MTTDNLNKMIEQYTNACAQEKEAKLVKDALKGRITEHMIEADLDQIPTDNGTVSLCSKVTITFKDDIDPEEMLQKFKDVEGFVKLNPGKLKHNAEAVKNYLATKETEYITYRLNG